MIKKTTYFLVSIMLLSPMAYADASSSANALAAEQAKLDAVMADLKSCYAKKPDMQIKLAGVDRSWNTYRKAISDAAFPRKKDESVFESYGSLGAEELAELNISLVKAHITNLESFYHYDSSECKPQSIQ